MAAGAVGATTEGSRCGQAFLSSATHRSSDCVDVAAQKNFLDLFSSTRQKTFWCSWLGMLQNSLTPDATLNSIDRWGAGSG